MTNGIAAENIFQLKERFLQHLLRTKVNEELHCTLLTQKDYNKLLQEIKLAKVADDKTTLHCNTEGQSVTEADSAENYCENN